VSAESAGPVPSKRRGRPQQFPRDPTSLSGETISVDHRVAWLLSVSRILGARPDLAQREAFVAALDGVGVKADATRISRWESGQQRVPDRVVETYELVLGLPSGHLRAPVLGLRRAYGAGPAGSTNLTVFADPATELEDAVEQAMTGTADGETWLRLSGALTRVANVYLPQQVWAAVVGPLVSELQRSSGTGHLLRREAAAVLVRSRVAQRHVLRALGEQVMDPDVQVIGPALSLLGEVSGTASSELVLRLLASENAILRHSATSVAVTKAGRGHFSEAALDQLEAHAIRGISRHPGAAHALDAIELTAHLEEAGYQRVLALARDRDLRTHQALVTTRAMSEIIPSDQARTITRELSATVQAAAPAPFGLEPDPMLERLLREALFHANKQRRFHAAVFLATSPYARPIANACRELALGPSETVAARAWTLLGRIGPETGSAGTIHLALAEPRPTVRSRALLNVGVSRERLGAYDADGLVDLATSTDSPDLAHAASFALGMQGARQLQELAARNDHPSGAAAAWWLRTGPAIWDEPSSGGRLHVPSPR
jgi:hypothetical protein